MSKVTRRYQRSYCLSPPIVYMELEPQNACDLMRSRRSAIEAWGWCSCALKAWSHVHSPHQMWRLECRNLKPSILSRRLSISAQQPINEGWNGSSSQYVQFAAIVKLLKCYSILLIFLRRQVQRNPSNDVTTWSSGLFHVQTSSSRTWILCASPRDRVAALVDHYLLEASSPDNRQAVSCAFVMVRQVLSCKIGGAPEAWGMKSCCHVNNPDIHMGHFGRVDAFLFQACCPQAVI